MAISAKERPDLRAIPMLMNESLYLCIDVGNGKHVAGFVSKTLLQRHERFEACPALTLENSREGFRTLIERVRTYVPLEHIFTFSSCWSALGTTIAPSSSICRNWC